MHDTPKDLDETGPACLSLISRASFYEIHLQRVDESKWPSWLASTKHFPDEDAFKDMFTIDPFMPRSTRDKRDRERRGVAGQQGRARRSRSKSKSRSKSIVLSWGGHF